MNVMRVAVSVATVWSSPDAARDADRPALQNPADISGWLDSLTVDMKLDLWSESRIQTQALLGTEVIVLHRSGDWAQVCIPEQRSSKNGLGYPGWIPLNQLAEAGEEKQAAVRHAEVTAKRAVLRSAAGDVELSFLTCLPVIGETDKGVSVAAPNGTGYIAREEVRLVTADESASTAANVGLRIVSEARRFIGLPYMWGGMSSFGYDCSGFAYSMHRAQGIAIPRDAADQAAHGIKIAKKSLEPGDLLFFAKDEGRLRVHHVAIYTGDGAMIHSPDSRGGVEEVLLSESKLVSEHCLSVRYW